MSGSRAEGHTLGEMGEDEYSRRCVRRRVVRGRRQIRLGLSLVAVSVVLLAVVGVGAWFYLSFTLAVSGANERLDAETRDALDTPPPATVVTVPEQGVADQGTDAVVMDALVLGTDARPGTVEGAGASDVLMLLHVDTRQDFLTIMSIHRDLWVDIPGYGKDRINAAYYLGGPAKVVATIKSVFGIDVTQYVQVGFVNFANIIDRMGGVYVDVDRHYTDTPFWSFDLAPGYQRLDGQTALLYSRYRFDETGNYGRMLRQQRVLASLRDQVDGLGTALKLPGIVDTIMESATTSLTADQMLNLAEWLTKLPGRRVKQVFVIGPIEQIDGKSVAVLDSATLAGYVEDYLTPPGAQTENAASARMGSLRPFQTQPSPALVATADEEALRLALTETTAAVVDLPILDSAKWRTAQDGVSFPLNAPTYLPDGYTYAGKAPAKTGAYDLETEDGVQPAIRILYRDKNTSQYLGISATTWTEAPLAASGKAYQRGDVTYTVVGTLGKPDHVWWISDGVLYWVSNTLTYTVGAQELLQIAESTRPLD